MKILHLLPVLFIVSTTYAGSLDDARVEIARYDQLIATAERREITLDESVRKVQRAYITLDKKTGDILAVDDLVAAEMGDGVLDIKSNRYYVRQGAIAAVRTSDTFVFTSEDGKHSKPFAWGGDILVFEKGNLQDWFLTKGLRVEHDDAEWDRMEKGLTDRFTDLIQLFKKTPK